MKALALVCLTTAMTLPALAQTTVAEYGWKDLIPVDLASGEVVEIDGRTALKVAHAGGEPLQAALLQIDQPPITAKRYALAGEVMYEGVEDGYFETWQSFPAASLDEPATKYFSRARSTSGPAASLKGTSPWRKFMVPFDWSNSAEPPSLIEFNLVLSGPGRVYIGPVRLVELPRGAWWSDREAGMIGGVGGAVFGCLAGLAGVLAARGRARSFVLGTLAALIVLGAASAVAALIALGQHQPYAVWFPLGLLGVLTLIVLPGRWKDARAQYQRIELRKMAAMDG